MPIRVTALRWTRLCWVSDAMPHVTIGLRVRCLQLPLRDALRRAAQLGAEAVQIDALGELSPQNLTQTAQRDLRHYLKHLGLQLSALGFPTRLGYDTADGLDQRVSATQAVMGLAYRLGARVVTNQLGRVPDDTGAEAWAVLTEALGELAAHGDRVGTVFAAEIGPNPASRLRQLLDRHDSAGLGVSYDPGSVLLHGGDPLAGVVELGGAIVYSHARDARRDTTTGDVTEDVPGTGEVDWRAYLAALEGIGYNGSLTVHRSGPALSVDDAGASIAFLKQQRSA